VVLKYSNERSDKNGIHISEMRIPKYHDGQPPTKKKERKKL
jgi:hypothetical protein